MSESNIVPNAFVPGTYEFSDDIKGKKSHPPQLNSFKE
jgi:hypothetical protein